MKQVLILNITRMGDLVQMGTLLGRLREEWPGCAIDLVIDRRFAPITAMLPGLRDVVLCDAHEWVYESRAAVKDVVELYEEVSAWARPLLERNYDRIINLTFNRASALLAGYVGASDIRGARSAWDGGSVIDNPWMAYFTDMHQFRRLNRFNLVDLYALGGSQPGTFVPLQVSVGAQATDWARRYLYSDGQDRTSWIAVQAGASDVMKAWRPQYFGEALARFSHQWAGSMVFLGTAAERDTIAQVLHAYKSAGGVSPVKNAAGQTTIDQMTALLAECRLLVTNDTGPMHLAVAVRTTVVNLSVGHVDFRETGPYGPGHWVLQPELDCAPCGFDRICAHHACKDRLPAEQVAALLLHVLGRGPVPSDVLGFRIYRSGVDEDQLGTFTCHAGHEPAETAWYAAFWRRYWYEAYTGLPSRVPQPNGPPPDLDAAAALLASLEPAVSRACGRADEIVRMAEGCPVDVKRLQSWQREQARERETLMRMGMSMPIVTPVTAVFLRAIQNDNVEGLGKLARHQAHAYRQWRTQLQHLHQMLRTWKRSVRARLPMASMPAQA